METLVTFSQSREDIILTHALSSVAPNNIFWIDVGANDPVVASVTQLFSLRGGRGINIEPQADLYQKRYEKLRNQDINLFVGIGESSGELILHGSGDIATMTKKPTANLRQLKVPVVTLTEVFEKYVPENQPVHFLKIDVEGFEEECIRGLHLEKYKPWIFCIECLPDESYEGYEPKLLKNGYVFTRSYGANRYYIMSDKTDILGKFAEIDHLDDYYEIVDLQDATRYLAYEQSTSWKITKPLRKIASAYARLRRER